MKFKTLSVVWLGHIAGSYGLKPFETVPERAANKWTRLQVADTSSLIDLKIVVRNPNEAAFEEHATQIATPFSGHYRKHLTASQLAEWVKPSVADVHQVRQWLSGHGIHSDQRHDLVVVILSVASAQSLLNTTYYNYQDRQGQVVRRTKEYYIPKHLAKIVQLVHPTVNFPHGKRDRQAEHTDASSHQSYNLEERSTDPCDSFFTTPACVNQVYNASYIPPYSSNVTVEAFEASGQEPNRTNLKYYLERFNPLPLKRKQFISFKSIDAPPAPPVRNDLYDQFIQMILGHGGSLRATSTSLGGKASVFMWGPPGYGQHVPPEHKLKQDEQFYVDYLHDMSVREWVPAVINNGNYAHEADLSHKYLRYLCQVSARVGARGVSLVTESGDVGSEAEPNKNGTIVFQGNWPGSCPWWTSVGSTVWDRSDKTEKATTWQTRKIQGKTSLAGASSGTFSQVFPRPKFQDTTVPAYVKRYKLEEMYGSKSGNTTGFVSSGRAQPDIAVFGSRTPVVANGKVIQIIGASAIASPVAAGIIGRLNAYEESKGRPPLGSLNTWFYQNPDLFNDITCCGNNGIVVFDPKSRPVPGPYQYGFPVAKGWDAVTGLGSFQFSKMQRALDDMAAAGALG